MTSLGGHIPHLYEDRDLRFRDLKELFGLLGESAIETYEKFDGQNIFATWDFNDDKLKFARNQQNVKIGGLDRYGLSLKFGDRPQIENSFCEAYDVLSNAFSKLDHAEKSSIFGHTGGIWFSAEIINPNFPNTIHYDNKSIVFHKNGPVLFAFDGKPLATNLNRNMSMLSLAVPKLNENIENNWYIYGPKKYSLKPINENDINIAKRTIDEICKHARVQETQTIRFYLYKKIMNELQRFPMVPDYMKLEIAKKYANLPGAMRKNEILKNIYKFEKEQVEIAMNEIESLMDSFLKPIEECIHKFSYSLLENSPSDFIEKYDDESNRIKEEFNKCCDEIRNSGDEKDIKLVENMVPKVGRGRVVIEGLVFRFRDRLYKITGAFAPMNRVIATVRYKANTKAPNASDVPLANFISAG